MSESVRVAEARSAFGAFRAEQARRDAAQASSLFDAPALPWEAPASVSSDWAEHALGIVRHLAEMRETLSVIDIAPLVDDAYDNRALGAVLLTAARRGWIEKGPYIDGGPSRHNRPVRQWRSRLCGAA